MNRDVLLTVSTRVLMLFCGVFTSVLTARLLGPEGRGEYFVMVVFAATIVQLANLGVHVSNTYELARDPKLLGPLLANSVWISLVFGGLVAIVAAAALTLSGAWGDIPPERLLLGVALAPPSLFFLLGGGLLVSIRRVALFNVWQLASSLVLLASLVAAWLVGGGVSTYLAATVLAWLTSGGGMLWSLCRLGSVRWQFRWDLVRENWRYAGRAYLACLLSFLLIRSNVFALNQLGGAQQAGFYSVAAQIADVLWIFPTALGTVLFPRLVRRECDGSRDMWRQLFGVGGVMLVLCLVCAATVEPFVRLVFGPAFVATTPIMWWMLPGVLLQGVSVIASQFLAARGIPRSQIIAWVLALIVQLAASWALIPNYGGVGAAAALSLGALVGCAQLLTLAWRDGCAARDTTDSANAPERLPAAA